MPTLLAAVLLSACTNNDTPATKTSTSSGASSVPSSLASSTPPASHTDYTYENAGVIAQMKYAPDKSTLTVTNHSGAEIPAPGIYMLDARDGHRIAGTVQDAAVVPSGTSKDFSVTFAQQVDEANVGLMILLIGHANYGAFVPPTTGK
ncbi:MAG: hypothetical protein ACJ76P_09875 [Actinomycetota bacterium]